MHKIKLKPNLIAVEIGIGSKINLKVEAGETIEVAEELLDALLSFGQFEEVTEESGNQKTQGEGADPNGQNAEPADKQQELSRDPAEISGGADPAADNE